MFNPLREVAVLNVDPLDTVILLTLRAPLTKHCILKSFKRKTIPFS